MSDLDLFWCPFQRGRKGPIGREAIDWNLKENCITTIQQVHLLDGQSIGLAHAYSTPPTGAVDVDDFRRASEWLAGKGIDLAALLMAEDAVQISSGRENRAKLLYRLPRPMRTVVVQEA